MMDYDISECIKKYGANDYLKVLRKRYMAGRYSLENFTMLAARAYFFIQKPLRALTLLKSIGFYLDSDSGQRRLLDLLSHERPVPPFYAGCSLNMIVKNEADSLADALDSVDDCMDEMIICDTGSTDGTQRIARLYGAKVLQVPWQNDFSAARNRAIEASTRPWIFWMDADDRLERQSQADLLALISSGPPQAASFCVINEQNGVPASRFLQVRLFPRMEGIVFERRVHEQIMFSARRKNLPFPRYPSIRIIHTGYSDPCAQRRKAARNASLIELELADHPGDPALLLNYGDCHAALGDIDRAIATYRPIADNPALMREHPDVYVQAHFNIGYLYLKKGDAAAAKDWLARCIRHDATRTEALLVLGGIFEKGNELEKAFDCFFRASRIAPPVRQTATDDNRIRMEAIFRLAKLLLRLDRAREAEGLLKHTVAAYPQVVEFHSLLGETLLRQQKLREAAASFMQSLSLSSTHNKEACSGMAAIYEKLNDPAKAEMFSEMAQKA
jgi:glycosyltransferase involved in cell wall biosynthesis